MIKKWLAGAQRLRDKLFSAEAEQDDCLSIVLFLLTILFYICYQMVTQPGMVLGGEMWAEMATNYFSNANSPSYLDNFFATDAGYIPLPQRLIAFVGSLFHLSAASIPYFYTWSSMILSGMMTGAFCLARFRTLVKSDLLRFVAALSILIVADFETRTFVSFTYFSAFFVAIVTSRHLVDDSDEMPWWTWLVPILIISKPAVLAVLPAMIATAAISRSKKFRLMTIIVVALGIVQISRMIISTMAGEIPSVSADIGIISKIMTSFGYFFGFSGGYILGKAAFAKIYFMMISGFIMLCASLFAIYKKKSNAGAIIIVGFSLLFFNVLLNSFALSDLWNQNFAQLKYLPVQGTIVVGFSGCILVVSGSLSILASQKMPRMSRGLSKNLAALLFIVWFMATGWLSFAGRVNKEPIAPIFNMSQWQNMATAIDVGISPLCVPVNPWQADKASIYSRNCGLLNPLATRYDRLALINNPLFFDIAPPTALSDKRLVSAALLVRPFSPQKTLVAGDMTVVLADGSVQHYSGTRYIDPAGGMLLLTGRAITAIKDISSIRITFNTPVEIILAYTDPTGALGIAWLGN